MLVDGFGLLAATLNIALSGLHVKRQDRFGPWSSWTNNAMIEGIEHVKSRLFIYQ